MSYIGQTLAQGKASRSSFTASGGETTVTVENGYQAGQLSVYLNGVKLVDTGDFGATNGTTITGLSPALVAGDIIEFVALDTFSVSDTVPVSGGEFTGDLITRNILPDGDDTRDLGSPSKQWQNIYTGDLHLKNERGSWTVIEEENYLTLRNNNTNKVYKLVMEEI